MRLKKQLPVTTRKKGTPKQPTYLYRWQYEDEIEHNSYTYAGVVRYAVVEPLPIQTRPIRCQRFVADGSEYRILSKKGAP